MTGARPPRNAIRQSPISLHASSAHANSQLSDPPSRLDHSSVSRPDICPLPTSAPYLGWAVAYTDPNPWHKDYFTVFFKTFENLFFVYYHTSKLMNNNNNKLMKFTIYHVGRHVQQSGSRCAPDKNSWFTVYVYSYGVIVYSYG